ncbi:hypothetical protein O181_031931 [Austropuccinia psidii MF-1]|uniref:Uncharacterized protein n=1 Tax=Austropuccinia psidii MF-1 TaxID=1389203 RepID=A0A9Q3D1G0_9BASI|nr:hypothetical protein [Austropuccinia psidii MF-1]
MEKACNTSLPQDSMRKDLIQKNPTAAIFKGMLYKSRKHAVRLTENSFSYSKVKWHKSHDTPYLKVGDLELVSTTYFNSIKGCKNIKDSFSRPLVIKALHWANAVEVELSETISNKHPKFQVILINPYKSGDSEKLLLRN